MELNLEYSSVFFRMRGINALLVVGARPQFIKSAPLIKEILSSTSKISLTIIHSGQHYDHEMSEIFFSQLKIPRPKLNLQTGSSSHASQTTAIMVPLEALMSKMKPDVVIAPGDTNTTLGTALAAAKCGLRVAHLEAGLRSGDMSMPEEINRRLTDHCSSLLFAPTRTAVRNLTSEGLTEYTRFTGDTMVDALHFTLPVVASKEKNVLERLGVLRRNYLMVTLHRPANVDDPAALSKIMNNLRRIDKSIPVLFPVHPRTRKQFSIANFKLDKTQIRLVPPQGYVENLALLRNAKCLLTDSGGMQKEAFLLDVPCITLRSTTEWPETLVDGRNRLADLKTMLPLVNDAISSDKRPNNRQLNPFGNGRAAHKIRLILEEEV